MSGNSMLDQVRIALESFSEESLLATYKQLENKFKSLKTLAFGEHKLSSTLHRNLSADIYVPGNAQHKFVALW